MLSDIEPLFWVITERGAGGNPKIACTQNMPPSIIANYIFANPSEPVR